MNVSAAVGRNAARIAELGTRTGDAAGTNALGDVVGRWATAQQPGSNAFLVHAGQFGLVREDQIETYERALGDRIDVVEVPGWHIVYWDAFDATADAIESFLHSGG